MERLHDGGFQVLTYLPSLVKETNALSFADDIGPRTTRERVASPCVVRHHHRGATSQHDELERRAYAFYFRRSAVSLCPTWDAVRASRPHDADVIVVGDFNLSTNDLKTVLPGFMDLTQGTGSTLNLHDGVTSTLFDHALVEENDADAIGATAAAVLDVRSYATSDSFYRSVSDHLPIRIS